MSNPERKDSSPSIAVGRRRSPRVRVKGGPRVRCRRGAPGAGPDLAPGVLDVSEDGIRLLVSIALQQGEDIEVILEGPGEGQTSRHPARVVWSVPTADGKCCIGARLQKPLSSRDLQALSYR
jgi:hypothetical protein